MLCDDFLATLVRLQQARPDDALNTAFAERLRRAQRFVLSPLVVDTINDLAEPDKIESSRDHLFTPAEDTWIECTGSLSAGYGQSNRHGFLLAGFTEKPGKRSIVVGNGAYVTDRWSSASRIIYPALFQYDFPGDGDILTPGTGAAGLDWRKLGAWIGAALALINTPRISVVREHDQTKLNAAREKRGQPPYLSWHEVNLTVDAGALVDADRKVETGEKAFHHVRAFMRIKRGKVEIVRPHWRGNPEKGVIRSRHVVRRAEDEGGEWKGGPLPPPQIIKEMQSDEEASDE